MLRMTNITKSYRQKTVLADISLEVAPGECVGLAGENSCGKTTLISIAAGLLKPDGGSVTTQGAAALAPQQPEISPTLTVRENLCLWYAAHGLPARDIFSQDSPESRLGLAQYARTRADALSGGRQKRLSIAIALLGNPAVLLLDEPFNALDVWGRREMEEIISQQKAMGRAVLLTAHEPMELAAVCDRVALMREGRIARTLTFSGKTEAEIAALILQYIRNEF